MTRLFAIATLIVTGLVAARADAGTPCNELLGNNSYRCQVRTAPDATPTERCLTFVDGGGVGRQLCSCLPRGKVSNLAWESSAEFVCVGVQRVGTPEEPVTATTMLSGLATRTAIKRGFAMDDQGAVEALECVLDATCAPPPTE